VWSLAALLALYQGFPGNIVIQVIFVAAAVYYVAQGLSRSAGPAATD